MSMNPFDWKRASDLNPANERDCVAWGGVASKNDEGETSVDAGLMIAWRSPIDGTWEAKYPDELARKPVTVTHWMDLPGPPQ